MIFLTKKALPPPSSPLSKTSVAISSVCFAHLSPNIHPCPSEAWHGGHSDGSICGYFPHPEPSSCGEHLPQNQSNKQVKVVFTFGCRLVTFFFKEQTILSTSTPPPIEESQTKGGIGSSLETSPPRTHHLWTGVFKGTCPLLSFYFPISVVSRFMSNKFMGPQGAWFLM